MARPAHAVLLLTSSADHFTVDRVAAELRNRGGEPIRFNTDLFPHQLRLSVGRGPVGSSGHFFDGDQRVSADEVAAVWLRHLVYGKPSPQLDSRDAEPCARETAAALDGFL